MSVRDRLALAGFTVSTGRKRTRKLFAAIERLESRVFLSGDATFAIDPTHPTPPPLTTIVYPDASSSLTPPFTPAEIREAYQINDISFNGVTGNGAGQTIALIDAYNDPDLAKDANTFSSMYGLPQFTVAGDGPTLTIENEYGSTSNLPANSTPGGWDVEESLDVEWAHSVAPEANILVVEGNSYSTDAQFLANEVKAINVARNTPGVSVVSMSFEVPTYSGETALDSTFTTPAGHQPITFFASTGDSGTPNGYPSDSPNVVAVGGTSLTISGDGAYGGETGWYGSGGGISKYEPQPIAQSAQAVAFSTTQRTTPDVSWLADPNTGVVILDTFYQSTPFGIGGTSLACPMWAAMTAIADQGRALNNLPSLDGPTQTLPLLYTLPASDFHDITSGNNGFSAGIGYDLVTGIGSPDVPAIVADMSQATFVYVDGNATGNQSGSSWANAYTSFQQVLTGAPSAREYVLVGQGTYVPGDTTSSTFQLQDNTSIIGSFAGFGASDPDRSGSAYPTILSGNLGNSQNATSVVTGSGTESTAFLSGFTISAGAGGSQGGGLFDSSGSPSIENCTFTDDSASSGGGIYNLQSSPTLIDCTFTNDTADSGGAVFDDTGSSPTFQYCTFTANSAANTGGAIYGIDGSANLSLCMFTDNSATQGGALFDDADAAPSINNCTFASNTASAGGAMFNLDAAPTAGNCAFQNNSATNGDGGAIDNTANSTPDVLNCVFESNTASAEGGAIANNLSAGTIAGCAFVANSASFGGAVGNDTSASPVIDNCTFTANSASSDGGAMYDVNASSPVITNCILWLDSDSTGEEIFNSDAQSIPSVSTSDVSGGYAGAGNLDADPLFIQNAGSAGNPYGDLELQQFSPCINVGNNSDVPSNLTTDVAGHPRIIGGIVDIGAYEATYVYVDAAATGANNGSSWVNAFTTLATPLADSFYGEQIDVSGGTYKPTTGTNRDAAFVIDDGVSIYGGYEALAGSSPFTRNTSVYPTILSGAIAGGGNSYNVVVFNGAVDATTILDGVTVTGGSGDSTGSTIGAGIFVDDGSPIVNNCIITGNTDNGGTEFEGLGAGVFASGGSPTFTNCTISNNTVEGSTDGGFGGGMLDEDSNLTLTNCVFSGNSAVSAAGGLYNYGNSLVMSNCSFTSNTISVSGTGDGAGMFSYLSVLTITDTGFTNNSISVKSGGDGFGGGMVNFYSYATLTNCLFDGDSSATGGGTGDGGGLFDDEAKVILLNCTFSRNSAHTGGGMYNEDSTNVKVTNSILYGDTATSGVEDFNSASTLTITFSDVQGGFNGTGDINTSPMFTSTSNFTLQPTSPCINVGSNSALPAGDTTDLAGNPRIFDGTVDLGAYESQSVTITWSGSGDGLLWSNPANWIPKRVPDQLEDVVIPSGKTIEVTGGTYIARSITSSSPIEITSGTLTVLGAVSMTTASLTIVSSGTLQLGNGGSVGSVSGNVVDNGLLQIDRSDSSGVINANVSGTGSVTLNGAGIVTFAGSNSYSGSTNISEGSLVISSAYALSAHSSIVNDSSLSIQAGTSAAPTTAASLSGTGVLMVGAPSKAGYLVLSANGQSDQQSNVIVNNGSTLDLTNNTLFINYGTNPSPISAIAAELALGYAGGLWNGAGIISSAVAAENISQNALVYSIGYADGADGIVSGLSSGQIEILPTLAGDAKLEGQVVFGDFQLLAQYFGSSGSWDEGNFTYGSVVDFGDFQLLSQNFGLSAVTAAGSISSIRGSAVAPAVSLSTNFVSWNGSTADESLLEGSDTAGVPL